MRPSAHGASACAGGVSMFTRNGNIRAQHGGGAERSKASTILAVFRISRSATDLARVVFWYGVWVV